MTIRHANWLVLLAFTLVGVYYLVETFALGGADPWANFDTIRFPLLLGALLIGLCLLEILRSWRRADPEDDAPFAVPNAGKVVATILLAALFFAVWWWTSQFYLAGAVFFFALVMLYLPERTPRGAGIAALVAAVFMALLYVVFDLTLGVNLT